MLAVIRTLFGVACFAGLLSPANAREWKDVTGTYSLEADLIGFDDQMVILQRANKELGSCPIAQLSEADRQYLQSKEAQEIHAKNLETMQTWTMKSGLKVLGKVVNYDRRDVTIQRRRGKIYVNDKLYENLPEVYQTMLLKVIAHLESIDMPNKAALDTWVLGLRGQPKTYTLEGVILELENGDEYGVPFFLFADQDQQLLQSGWASWLKDQPAPAAAVAADRFGAAAKEPAAKAADPKGADPKAADPNAAKPLAINPLGTNPLGTNPLGTNPLGTNPLGTNPLGTNPLGTNPLGTNPPATGASDRPQDQDDYEHHDDHAFRLQSLAAAYQRNQQINQQIAIMNLNMQAIQSGLTSAWEVTLYPVDGNPYPPRWVIALGRNSEVATDYALQQNPGFVSGPVRRISR